MLCIFYNSSFRYDWPHIRQAVLLNWYVVLNVSKDGFLRTPKLLEFSSVLCDRGGGYLAPQTDRVQMSNQEAH